MESRGWVTRSSGRKAQCPWGVDHPLRAEDAAAFGLGPGLKHSHTYASRPFVCMGYGIQPVLHCDLDANSTGLRLRIHAVSLQGLGVLERWVRLQGWIQLSTQALVITAEQWLEISLARRGPLAWAPASTVGAVAEQLLEEAHQRLQRTLMRRLSTVQQRQGQSADAMAGALQAG